MRVLKLRCIVSTDLMSRGVDLPDVQVVINFDLPSMNRNNSRDAGIAWPDLIHRIGRAGRFGSKAMAINFISEDISSDSRLSQFKEFTVDELASKVSKQLQFTLEGEEQIVKPKDERVAQRLRKEHKLIDRRDELNEEFKDTSKTYKRRKIEATKASSMIGQW